MSSALMFNICVAVIVVATIVVFVFGMLMSRRPEHQMPVIVAFVVNALVIVAFLLLVAFGRQQAVAPYVAGACVVLPFLSYFIASKVAKRHREGDKIDDAWGAYQAQGAQLADLNNAQDQALFNAHVGQGAAAGASAFGGQGAALSGAQGSGAQVLGGAAAPASPAADDAFAQLASAAQASQAAQVAQAVQPASSALPASAVGAADPAAAQLQALSAADFAVAGAGSAFSAAADPASTGAFQSLGAAGAPAQNMQPADNAFFPSAASAAASVAPAASAAQVQAQPQIQTQQQMQQGQPGGFSVAGSAQAQQPLQWSQHAPQAQQGWQPQQQQMQQQAFGAETTSPLPAMQSAAPVPAASGFSATGFPSTAGADDTQPLPLLAAYGSAAMPAASSMIAQKIPALQASPAPAQVQAQSQAQAFTGAPAMQNARAASPATPGFAAESSVAADVYRATAANLAREDAARARAAASSSAAQTGADDLRAKLAAYQASSASQQSAGLASAAAAPAAMSAWGANAQAAASQVPAATDRVEFFPDIDIPSAVAASPAVPAGIDLEQPDFADLKARAESFQQRGVHLVAAGLFAQAAGVAPTRDAWTEVLLNEMACYVKAGKPAEARNIAFELRRSGLLDAAQAVKVNAVIGMM